MIAEAFNPQMVELAREAKGYSRAEFARLLGVSQPKVSRVEEGISEPTPDELTRYAELLDQPTGLFFQHGVLRSQNPVSFFRKTTSLPLKTVTQFSARMNLRRLEILREIEPIGLRSFTSIPHISVESIEQVELAAAELRRWWRLPRGPIKNLTQVVEDAGCVIELFDFGVGKIDALALGGGTTHPVVFLNRAYPIDRRRFSLAHEVGHLVLHRSITETVEDEANVFAGALLMPAEDIVSELYPLNVEKLIQLKAKWGCSMQAILKRAAKLNRISERSERFLWMQLGQLGYRTSEPLKGDLPDEQPTPINERIKKSQ